MFTLYSCGYRPSAMRSPPVGFSTKQVGRRQRRLYLAATTALIVAGLFASGARAEPPPGSVSVNSVPSLFPEFAPDIHDYVVRCNDGPVMVDVHASSGWEAAIDDHPFRRGRFSEVVPLSEGRAFTLTVRNVRRTQLYRYYTRCLPDDFPKYTFTRYAPISPRFFSVAPRPPYLAGQYAIIFDNHGVPIWWYPEPAYDTRVLPDGSVLWWNFSGFATHRLDGSVIRTFKGVGVWANFRDLQLLPNGNHLIGAYVQRRHVDTRPYGPSDATVEDAELQEVSATGDLVWEWKSREHISLSETGRWWPDGPPPRGYYQLVHLNGFEPAGNSVIASFRSVDAVYKINKSTGNIVWKLGGTTTPRSLKVKDDPRRYTFGGQHDPRRLPDGTLTVFDNRRDLGQAPRAVRFRIDERARTATLLQSITDPSVPESNCCGSARRMSGGDWLISWGRDNPVGGYKPNGERTFRLTFDSSFARQAEPVPAGVVSAQDLRQAMDARCSSGCG
jgi:Arylsulfotransferase (ASST)